MSKNIETSITATKIEQGVQVPYSTLAAKIAKRRACTDPRCECKEGGLLKFATHCPAHRSKYPSLDLTLTVVGTLAAHCGEGCSFDEIAEAFVRRGMVPAGTERIEGWDLLVFPPDPGIEPFRFVPGVEADWRSVLTEGVRQSLAWRALEGLHSDPVQLGYARDTSIQLELDAMSRFGPAGAWGTVEQLDAYGIPTYPDRQLVRATILADEGKVDESIDLIVAAIPLLQVPVHLNVPDAETAFARCAFSLGWPEWPYDYGIPDVHVAPEVYVVRAALYESQGKFGKAMMDRGAL